MMNPESTTPTMTSDNDESRNITTTSDNDETGNNTTTIPNTTLTLSTTSSTSSSSTSLWESKKVISLTDDIPKLIKNGSNVYISSSASTPELILESLISNWSTHDIHIIQMLPGGTLPHLNESIDRFRTSTFFSYRKTMYYDMENNNASSSSKSKSVIKEGLADYKPMSISSFHRMLDENIITIDIAIIKVTFPHKGYVSLGIGVECTIDVILHHKQNNKPLIVIAEVTSYMPWTEGPSKIPIDMINYWIDRDYYHPNTPLKTTSELWPNIMDETLNHYGDYCIPTTVLGAIGTNVANLIPNGSTLKLDWNPLIHIVFPYLYNHIDLGLHTDVFYEGLLKLHEVGVFNNTKKNINTGCSVVGIAHGNNIKFYQYFDRNPAIEFHSMINYINNPYIISLIDNLILLIVGLKIDLTGQVTTNSIGHKFYGGVL